MTQPLYATREDVMRALDVKESARNRRQIDDALQAASRSVDGLCHRRFYPEQTTRKMDWPPRSVVTPWILRLNSNELISVTALTSGSTTIASSDYLLRRADDKDEPPYTRIELNLDTSASFGNGTTYQQDVHITGLFGYRNDETTLGATTGAIDVTQTTVNVDGPTSAEIGVGSLLRLDSERLQVTERRQLSTGQTGTLAGGKADVTLTVANGAAFAVDEMLLLDSERMLIVDIAGNSLTVERAQDGTVLAAHTGATIYAQRTLVVTRGVLGTTAATHSSGATVYRFDFPGLVRQLTRAEAIWALLQERSGWFRRSSASGGTGKAEVSEEALQALRDRTYTEHGRKARMRGV